MIVFGSVWNEFFYKIKYYFEWILKKALNTNGNEFSDIIKYWQMVKEIQFYILKYSWNFVKWVCIIQLQNATVLFFHLIGCTEQKTSLIALTFFKC